jgi:hypothetical protein
MTNLQKAIALIEVYATEWDEYDRLPVPASGRFGDDSDFLTRYWRVGGNVVITQSPHGLKVMRRHDLIVETRGLRYPAR